MSLVHVRLNFEYKGGKIGAEGVDHAAVGLAGQRTGRHAQEFFQKGFDAEVGQRGAEEHRRERTAAHLVHVEFPACAEQLHVVHQLPVALFADQRRDGRIIELDLHLVGPVFAGDAREEQQLAGAAVIDALELLAAADGPVAGVCLDAKLVFQLVEQVERVLRLAVHLVDEGENGDMAHGADLKQLARLRLDALRAVDDHDGRVRRHQRPVGILREVLMARRVQNVDAEALILELHDGRGHGNTALLFDLHPVGDGCAGIFFALDGAGLCDGSAVEQEFFGQCGFTGVRVRDDRKRPAPGDLFF